MLLAEDSSYCEADEQAFSVSLNSQTKSSDVALGSEMTQKCYRPSEPAGQKQQQPLRQPLMEVCNASRQLEFPL